MHYTTLSSSLAFMAWGAAPSVLATPTPPRAATLPLPARTIFQLDNATQPNSWFENLAVRRNGDLLVTMLQPHASLYSIRAPLSESPEASVISFDDDDGVDANGLLGIAETAPDVFVVASGTFSALAVPVEGSMAVWEVNLQGATPTKRLITKMPEAGLLNGVAGLPFSSPSSSSSKTTTKQNCSLPPSSPAVLIADSSLGHLWRVDLSTGAYSIAASLPEMQALPNATLSLGINGVKVRRGNLYFSNSNRVTVFRVPISESTGAISSTAAVEVAGTFVTKTNIDDFDVDEQGNVWVASNFDGTVEVARADGSGAVVVVGGTTELTVAGDTAVAFGRGSGTGEGERDVVFVSTGGALGNPVNGTITEPAKVVAIDRSGFY